ncbi:unnamed protein product, partial [Chrysoparadoxa australica]
PSFLLHQLLCQLHKISQGLWSYRSLAQLHRVRVRGMSLSASRGYKAVALLIVAVVLCTSHARRRGSWFNLFPQPRTPAVETADLQSSPAKPSTIATTVRGGSTLRGGGKGNAEYKQDMGKAWWTDPKIRSKTEGGFTANQVDLPSVPVPKARDDMAQPWWPNEKGRPAPSPSQVVTPVPTATPAAKPRPSKSWFSSGQVKTKVINPRYLLLAAPALMLLAEEGPITLPKAKATGNSKPKPQSKPKAKAQPKVPPPAPAPKIKPAKAAVRPPPKAVPKAVPKAAKKPAKQPAKKQAPPPVKLKQVKPPPPPKQQPQKQAPKASTKAASRRLKLSNLVLPLDSAGAKASGVLLLVLGAGLLLSELKSSNTLISSWWVPWWEPWQVLTAGAFALNMFAVTRGGRLDGSSARSEAQVVRLFNPAPWAFAIWGPIFLGEAIFAAYQALPLVSIRGSWWLAEVSPWFTAAMVFQSLWCTAFRPWAAKGGYLWLPALLLGLTGVSLYGATSVMLAALADQDMGIAGVIFAMLPLGVHFGWITAATLVNTNRWVAQITSKKGLKLAVSILSVYTAVGLGIWLTTLRKEPLL